MASTDARPVPIKNTAFRAVFPILDADGDLVTGAAGLDSEVSKDQGTFADCTNEATEIATSSGIYYLDLTSTEMNADCVAVIVKTTTTGAKTTVLVFYPQEAGDIDVDVQSWNGTAVASPHTAGYPVVTVKDGTGTGEIDTTSGGVLVSGFSTAAKAEIEQEVDDSIGGGTGTALTAIPWNSAWDAEVQSEVVDALNVDTYAEPGQGNPPATATLVQKIGYLYKAWRNRHTVTDSEYALYADDGTTKDQEAVISDDDTTFERGEITTGA